MTEITYTLLADGTSDRALIPILNWLIGEYMPDCAIKASVADLRNLPIERRDTLAHRIVSSLELYPGHLLFIHRDAEGAHRADREEEITRALEEARRVAGIPAAIPVVPVRMQEAWLLFDEGAIRSAVGNREGNAPLELPLIKDLECLPDPKAILHGLLKQAKELRGRRLRG